MPAESMLARWASEVPAHFALTLKARAAQHEKRLRDAEPDVTESCDVSQALGASSACSSSSCRPPQEDLPRLTDF